MSRQIKKEVLIPYSEFLAITSSAIIYSFEDRYWVILERETELREKVVKDGATEIAGAGLLQEKLKEYIKEHLDLIPKLAIPYIVLKITVYETQNSTEYEFTTRKGNTPRKLVERTIKEK